MKRVFLLICLTASPVLAEVEVVFTPNRQNWGSNRPYLNSAGLLPKNRFRTTPGGYLPNGGSGLPASSATAYTFRARFQYYPNYPSRYSQFLNPYVLKKTPATIEPLLGRLPCDPYLDDDGCLREEAGW